MDHHVPIGLFAKIFRWIRDFIALPGRIAALAVAKDADQDPRVKCPSCGTGRIGSLKKESYSYGSGFHGERTIGTCGKCHTAYEMTLGPERIVGMVRAGHSEPPTT